MKFKFIESGKIKGLYLAYVKTDDDLTYVGKMLRKDFSKRYEFLRDSALPLPGKFSGLEDARVLKAFNDWLEHERRKARSPLKFATGRQPADPFKGSPFQPVFLDAEGNRVDSICD